MKYNTLDHETFIETFYDNIFKFSKDEKYMNSMVKTITYYEKFYIYIINKYTPKYKIEKMSPIYILPIYIGLAEIFFLEEEIPAKVSINEAIQIAKIF
jgi:transcription termination factor NusB